MEPQAGNEGGGPFGFVSALTPVVGVAIFFVARRLAPVPFYEMRVPLTVLAMAALALLVMLIGKWAEDPPKVRFRAAIGWSAFLLIFGIFMPATWEVAPFAQDIPVPDGFGHFEAPHVTWLFLCFHPCRVHAEYRYDGGTAQGGRLDDSLRSGLTAKGWKITRDEQPNHNVQNPDCWEGCYFTATKDSRTLDAYLHQRDLKFTMRLS